MKFLRYIVQQFSVTGGLKARIVMQRMTFGDTYTWHPSFHVII